MYGLIMITKLMKCAVRSYWPAPVFVAALMLLSVIPARAQEQPTQTNVLRKAATIRLVRGQTIRLRITNNNNRGKLLKPSADPDVIVGASGVVQGHVKAFNAGGQTILQTDEVEILPGESHSFDIGRDDLPGRRDINDLYIFKSPRGSIRVRVEVVIIAPAAAPGQDKEPGVDRFPATFELIDNGSGKRILIGMLLPAIQK
jgi:hypothetical protein